MKEWAAVIDSRHDGETPATRHLVSFHHDFAEAMEAAADREAAIVRGDLSPGMNFWTDATVLKLIEPGDDDLESALFLDSLKVLAHFHRN